VISALNVITNFANDNTQTAPILSNYIDLAVKGVDASNLSAMNSAVDALSRTQVDTLTKVQTMVTAYAKILAEANGAAADDTPDSNPTANDFHAIGANVGQAGVGIHGGADLASSALALLDDAIAGLSTSAVDTVSEINDLGSAVDDVMNLAKLATGSAIPATTLTVADLTLLGVNTGLVNTAAELMAIQTAIIGTADSGSGVSTILALQAIVDANAH
jgi:hypothetical protein